MTTKDYKLSRQREEEEVGRTVLLGRRCLILVILNQGGKAASEYAATVLGSQKASIPVTLEPMIKVWISCVPSYVFTDSRFIMWRMIG